MKTIINERGDSVEYVSIGIEEDSVGVISDAQGQFTLTIPAGRKDELTFTHVSYQTTTIPYATYSDGIVLFSCSLFHNYRTGRMWLIILIITLIFPNWA